MSGNTSRMLWRSLPDGMPGPRRAVIGRLCHIGADVLLKNKKGETPLSIIEKKVAKGEPKEPAAPPPQEPHVGDFVGKVADYEKARADYFEKRKQYWEERDRFGEELDAFRNSELYIAFLVMQQRAKERKLEEGG
jgi:hypothetical protein